MKNFRALIATAAVIGISAFATSPASAESMSRQYYNLRMEEKCGKTHYGAKWFGAAASFSPIPIGGIFTAIITEDCDQWAMSKNTAERIAFERANPGFVRRYNAQYGGQEWSSGSSSTDISKQVFGNAVN